MTENALYKISSIKQAIIDAQDIHDLRDMLDQASVIKSMLQKAGATVEVLNEMSQAHCEIYRQIGLMIEDDDSISRGGDGSNQYDKKELKARTGPLADYGISSHKLDTARKMSFPTDEQWEIWWAEKCTKEKLVYIVTCFNWCKGLINKERKAELAVAVLDLDTEELSTQYGIHNRDMRDLYSMIENQTVDMFLTDPPYPAKFLPMYGELAKLAAAKLRPGAFCLAYSGQTHLPQVIAEMSQYLDYWWCFAISHTGGNQQIFHRDVLCGWKPILVFTTKNNNKLAKPINWVKDFVPGGGRDKRYHEWGQDASEVIPWIESFTLPNQLICDPFVGGGSIPMACKITERNFIGTELDVDNFNEAIVRVNRQ